MVKAVIYLTLIALSASSVLAVPIKYQRCGASASPADILQERDSDYAPTMFKREAETASLQEREPLIGLIGMLGNIGMKVGLNVANKAIATKIASNANRPRRPKVRRQRQPRRPNNRRKRDLEAEDEFDLAAREDSMEEFVERELDVLEREMNGDDDLLGREVEDLYLSD